MKRLDLCVMEKRGFSRTYAQEVIGAGLVFVKGSVVTRPGSMVFIDDVEVLAPDMPYVSRGGYKLAAALQTFGISLTGQVCLDVGASTGGFTDCMLKAGARMVYAVDVGTGQLAQLLTDDPRVIQMDGVDIRNLILPETVNFATCDISFISVTKTITAITSHIKTGGGFVCLIKPQFETEKRYLSKKGVVKDEKIRKNAVLNVKYAFIQSGLININIIESPITGRDGNIEYLAYSQKGDG